MLAARLSFLNRTFAYFLSLVGYIAVYIRTLSARICAFLRNRACINAEQ
jgi:hypothetical protein